MDIRHFKLTDEAVRVLEKAELGSKDVEERRHLQAVRLYGTGEPLDTILKAVQASERTLRRWAERYSAAGVGGLARRARIGNHYKLRRAERETIVDVLKTTTPAAIGLSERPHWTVRDVVGLVKERHGVEYVARSGYHAVLHAAGLSYQQATKVYRHQPHAAAISDWEADAEKK